MSVQATQTLHDRAKAELRRRFEETESDDPRILWWDDGAYLADVIERTCEDLGVPLHSAEKTPLELRADPTDGRQVWYVPHGKDDYDWFRDIRHTGSELEASIEDLTVQVYGSDQLQSWELYDATTTAGDRDEIARILYDELTGPNLPTLEQLRTKIVTGGHGNPVEYVLEREWASMNTDESTIGQVTDLLVASGVSPVEPATEPDGIVTATKRWAVAQWLIHEGADPDCFPPRFQAETGGTYLRPALKSVVVKSGRSEQLARRYLEPFWSDVLDRIEEPWSLVGCPVDGALEHRLWESWTADFEASAFEQCRDRATERHEALVSAFGDEAPWTRVWKQAIDVAALTHQLDTWEQTGNEDDLVALYADPESGTWQIDNAVLHLVVAGEPERDLPREHPARRKLDGLRENLLRTRYMEYLEELAARTIETVETDAPFTDEAHAHEFWNDHRDQLRSSERVALFVIDALRLDLARELASALREEDYEVEEEIRVGVLPSETKFGKGALTPGNVHGFDISLHNGSLVPERNGRRLTPAHRNSRLDNDGWSVTRDERDGWQDPRVAYFSNDLDDMGEKELNELESLLARRVETLKEFITDKLRQGDWERAFVVTDHGFVSLPDTVDIEGIRPPGDPEDVSRRWIASQKLGESGPGVRLDRNTHLGYLNDEVRILAAPQERFRKQGLGNASFYHGGILPQEFVLDFIEITQE